MPQFFVDSDALTDGSCSVSGDDFHHLVRVRRVRVNDIITLRSNNGKAMRARIRSIGTTSLEALLLSEEESAQITLAITLGLGLLKGRHFDLALQKTTEVGVSRIVPLITERSIGRSASEHKVARWERVVLEAAKQSLRADIPTVSEIRTFGDIIREPFRGLRIIAHPAAPHNAKEFMESNDAPDHVALLVGPEGGWSSQELALAEESGWTPLRFGVTQLRAETAAIVIPALCMYAWG